MALADFNSEMGELLWEYQRLVMSPTERIQRPMMNDFELTYYQYNSVSREYIFHDCTQESFLSGHTFKTP